MVASKSISSGSSKQSAVSVTAIVLAGERPEGDPLARHYRVPAKALVPVGGRAMGERVVETLRSARLKVRVFGRPDKLVALGGITMEPSGSSIATTVRPLVREPALPLLITTADHPLLSVAMVEDFVAEADGSDVAVGVVERGTLLAAYPDNRRTWLRFRGGAYSGANLFWIGSERALALLDIWARVEQQRKRGRALVGAFGPALLLGVGLRLLSLDAALARVGRRFGLSVRAVVLPQAEACIDVDKPEDRDLAERILASRT